MVLWYADNVPNHSCAGAGAANCHATLVSPRSCRSITSNSIGEPSAAIAGRSFLAAASGRFAQVDPIVGELVGEV